MRTLSLIIAFLFLAVTTVGCSFSHSSKSSSASSRSSSAPSPSRAGDSVQGTENSFYTEVASLTKIYANSTSSARDFQRDIGDVAIRHGIGDWGSDPETFAAIGRGLRLAGISRGSIDYLTFLQGLKNHTHYGNIYYGFDY